MSVRASNRASKEKRLEKAGYKIINIEIVPILKGRYRKDDALGFVIENEVSFFTINVYFDFLSKLNDSQKLSRGLI